MAGQEGKKNGAQYPFYIHDQYVKDLSFENPNYLLKYSDSGEKPEVSINIETHVSKMDEEHFEVELKLEAKSSAKDKVMFVFEMTYASLVSVVKELKQDVLEPILLVHCPFLMFPFVREIVANVTREGGFPPLMLEPVDFASLYLNKKKETGETAPEKDKKVN